MFSRGLRWSALAALVLALAACGGGSSGGGIIGGGGPQLSVTVSGSGSVGAVGTDITCSSGTCSGNVPSGTTVTLTATAASGYQFDGWSGACSSSGNSPSCSLTINANTSVTATFSQVAANSSPLTVSKAGSGTVTSSPAGINCGSDCGETYANGTTVTLTATPTSG